MGLAVSSFGGAIAGIVLPKLLESSGLFQDGKKEVDRYRESLDFLTDSVKRQNAIQLNAKENSPEKFDESQKSLKAKIEAEERVLKVAKEQYDITRKQVDADEESVKKKLGSQSFGVGSVLSGSLSMIGLGTAENQTLKKQAEAAREMVINRQNEINKLKEGLDKDGSLKRLSIEGDEARKREEREKKDFTDERDRLNRGIQESQKLKLQALEKYGTESQKLTAKQEREREELSEKMRGLVESESALAQQAAGHEAEAQKLKIQETEKALAKLKDPGMSAGLRTDSAEGISQRNKWEQGESGGKSVLQQQLDTQKKQLAIMEREARGEVLSPAEQMLKKGMQVPDAQLGPVVSTNSQQATRERPGWGSANGRTPEQTEAFRAQLELNRMVSELVRKPSAKVVQLN